MTDIHKENAFRLLLEAKVAKRDVRDAHSLAQKLIGKDRTLLIDFQVYKSENNKAS